MTVSIIIHQSTHTFIAYKKCDDPVYYYFTQFALPSVILLTLGTVALGVLQTVRGPKVETVEVFIENLPISFDKFRIVQISDLHVGQTIKYDYVNKAVAIANSLKPNIIALTGDMIDGRVARLRHDVSPLSNVAVSGSSPLRSIVNTAAPSTKLQDDVSERKD